MSLLFGKLTFSLSSCIIVSINFAGEWTSHLTFIERETWRSTNYYCYY